MKTKLIAAIAKGKVEAAMYCPPKQNQYTLRSLERKCIIGGDYNASHHIHWYPE